mmetsp:Transcript_20078/g.36080  ORF Transcript_20078/g.36080 Transcript_20078/m.36080 type:complete len:122 (+) Transcript_20078:200-565(+)
MVVYPDLKEDVLYYSSEHKFNHTYCARADVYHDIDNTGKQTNIAHVSRELVINFSNHHRVNNNYHVDNSDDEYLVDVMEANEPVMRSTNSKAVAVIIEGSLILITISAIVVALFFLVRRSR